MNDRTISLKSFAGFELFIEGKNRHDRIKETWIHKF